MFFIEIFYVKVKAVVGVGKVVNNPVPLTPLEG